MSPQRQMQLNLLTLPTPQRQVMLHLLREGPMDQATLAVALGQEPAALAETVAALTARGAVVTDGTGCLTAVLGHTRSRTLPARLWPALQTGGRLYSVQEIATLRAVVPILQFARARMGEFTDHGPGHVLRVKALATQLGYLMGLTPSEQHLLRAAALLHDVGNVVDRATHHIISQETVEKLTAAGQLPFSRREATLIGLICRWHRREYDPTRYDALADETVRTGLIASILRVADALDIDYRRVDYDDNFKRVLQLFYPEEVPFLDDLDTILGIRICCRPKVQLQVLVRQGSQSGHGYHLSALYKDVAETPLAWPIRVIECSPTPIPHNQPATHSPNADQPLALIACPFDPHSLVMAALSRKHLLAAGYLVDLLITPDSPESTQWLWRTDLVQHVPSGCSQLVIIGDRPDPTTESAVKAEVQRRQAEGVQITILNRHEANWARLANLLQHESDTPLNATLGGDWCYFWGDNVDEADLFWGRIAGLCTRDPGQSTIKVTPSEQRIGQGLLHAIYTRIAAGCQSARTSKDWVALALPILERIATDERSWFAAQSIAFVQTYTTLPTPVQVEGKVLHFELTAAPTPHTIFWGLEAAIEQQGRALLRGICFTMPYAIATWPVPASDGEGQSDMVELLAINHWCEEEAIPIRLLYPTDLGPTPEGNECAIRVRLPTIVAQSVIQALKSACNGGMPNASRKLEGKSR